MRKLIIAIDCDDVLVPTAPWIIDRYNKTYDTDVHISDFYSKDCMIWGTATFDEAAKRVGALLLEEEYGTIEPFSDAIEVVQRLSKVHELHLVTGRARYLEPVTLVMIEKTFPDFFQTIQHIGYFEGAKKNKGDVCKELGADVLVDDHIVHLRDVLLAGVKEVILFGDYPWNQQSKLQGKSTRCADWWSVEKEISEIATYG